MLSCLVMSSSLQPHGLHPARLLCPWGFSRQEYWSGLYVLLQGIFPTQGWNPGLPHCRQILNQLSAREAHFILIATSFSGFVKMKTIKLNLIECMIIYQLGLSLFYYLLQHQSINRTVNLCNSNL